MQDTITQSQYINQIEPVQLVGDAGHEPIPDIHGLDIQLQPARQAAVCGVAGCRETEQLVKGIIDRVGKRVLCADDMAELIQEEILNDE